MKIFFKLFLVNIFVFSLIAATIELGGQVYAFFHPSYKIIPFLPHPKLGWRFIANSEHILTGNHWYAREFSSKVKINSHGFRDFERRFKKNQSIIRIALLGDSMFTGRQLQFNATAGQLLEKKLNKEFGHKTGKTFEVLNFGVDGYGLSQVVINWMDYASKFGSDFVFLYVFERNYLRTISSTWCQRKFLGIDKLGANNCLDVRPIAVIKDTHPLVGTEDENNNFLMDYLLALNFLLIFERCY